MPSGQRPEGPEWRHPVAAYFPIAKPFTRLTPRTPRLGSCASGPAKPTGLFVALLSGRRGMIAGLAVTCNAMRRQRLAIGMGQVRSLPGDGRPRPRQPASRTSFPITQQMRRGSTLTRGGLGGGGSGGALHVTFCPGGGQNPRRDPLRLSAAPAPSPGRTTFASSHPA
jgi:hypothetical protein